MVYWHQLKKKHHSADFHSKTSITCLWEWHQETDEGWWADKPWNGPEWRIWKENASGDRLRAPKRWGVWKVKEVSNGVEDEWMEGMELHGAESHYLRISAGCQSHDPLEDAGGDRDRDRGRTVEMLIDLSGCKLLKCLQQSGDSQSSQGCGCSLSDNTRVTAGYFCSIHCRFIVENIKLNNALSCSLDRRNVDDIIGDIPGQKAAHIHVNTLKSSLHLWTCELQEKLEII